MINKLITKSIYSIYNILHRNRIKELYQDIKTHNESAKSFDLKKLETYLHSWGVDSNIEHLPVMTKLDIRKHVSGLHEKEVSSYVYTGGSSGNPLRVPYSKQREFMRTASITYYNEVGGYHIGDRFLLIRAKQKPKILQYLRNELLFIPHDLSPKKIQKISNEIVKKHVEVLIGYPSVIYEIAVNIENDTHLKIRHSVKSVITVSESIDDQKRLFIKKTFGCGLIDRYSNEETGVIAQQLKYGGDYVVDRYGIYTEILDSVTLEPVGENEVGKVVITDVYNDLIPVIRYDTGDYAMVSKYRDGHLFSINKIVGRTSEEIYATDGTPVSSLSLGPFIHQPLSEADLNCQFQFAQVGEKDYQFRIRGKKSDEYIGPVKRITEGLQSVLGRDANIESVYLSIIEPLPSGKRPLYRNEMKN